MRNGARRRRTGEFLSWQHYTHFPATSTFAPDVLILGKAMQLACVATKKVPAVTGKGRGRPGLELPGGFSLSPNGEEPTTTTAGLRRERMLYVLKFLRGQVALLARVDEKTMRPTNPPVFFDFRKEARDMHAVVESALKAHWPEESFSKYGELWGCGLMWYASEPVYRRVAHCAAVFSVLDEEPITRCLLSVRPVERLKMQLSNHFSKFKVPKRQKRKQRDDSVSPGPAGAEEAGRGGGGE